jgi:hypothetical protein
MVVAGAVRRSGVPGYRQQRHLQRLPLRQEPGLPREYPPRARGGRVRAAVDAAEVVALTTAQVVTTQNAATSACGWGRG